jgi:hypothetical protein
MEAVVEVEVRRATEPMPIHEATRAGATLPAAAAQPGPAAKAPTPAEKGWFGKLFAK